MISHAMRWASLVSLLCLTGCGNGFVWDEVLDGPYRLVAIGISEDMSLCRSVDTSGTCVGDGLPDATVFQAADLLLATAAALALSRREDARTSAASLGDLRAVARSGVLHGLGLCRRKILTHILGTARGIEGCLGVALELRHHLARDQLV